MWGGDLLVFCFGVGELFWGQVVLFSAGVEVVLDVLEGEGVWTWAGEGFVAEDDGEAEVVGFGGGVFGVGLYGWGGCGWWVFVDFWGGRNTGVLRCAQDDSV
jgi:hypothetical protein